MLVGTLASPHILRSAHTERQAYLERVAASGLDHVFIADHVSFHVGTGMDALINAATIAASHPTLRVCVGVYLLALRHPVTVARQLATLAESSPGQLILGVGVGGEDRNEIAMCGVDPATRGRRTDECLAVLQGLLTGESMDYRGEFFQFERAWIKPAPAVPIPVVVGGRAAASLARAARYGDGWLGIWSTAQRYRDRVNAVNEQAATLGRAPLSTHGLQVWTGIDNNRRRGRARLARAMETMYRLPFERFARYSPCGSAEEIAEYLAPYRDAGCRLFNIMPVAPGEEQGIEAVARIKELLQS